MRNFYEIVKSGLHFNSFELGDAVCVEYTCPLVDQRHAICSQLDYLVHVLSGKKTWETVDGIFVVEAGDTLFLKKGAQIAKQFFDDDFCMLGFFVPDSIIRESFNEMDLPGLGDQHAATSFTATRLDVNDYLSGFFQSMLGYFSARQGPPDPILKLKLKELVANLALSGKDNGLAGYLASVAANDQPSLTGIMESNFRYNMKLEEFAKLCHRSLSTFKRDFKSAYQTTPGKWLLARRLEYAAGLISKGNHSVTEAAFDSGFEDSSHFSRVFRNHYGQAPSEYRKTVAT